MQKTRPILGLAEQLVSNQEVGRTTPQMKPGDARQANLIIIDQYGYIRSCGLTVAALAGVTVQDMVGKPVKALLPSLPIRFGTPGYNIAFAVFSARTETNPVIDLRRENGAAAAVTVHLDLLETQPDYLLSLEIEKQTDRSFLRAA